MWSQSSKAKSFSEREFIREEKYQGPVWLVISNQYFHILNNLTHFFTHTYIKNTQTTLFKLTYQTGSKCPKTQCSGI